MRQQPWRWGIAMSLIGIVLVCLAVIFEPTYPAIDAPALLLTDAEMPSGWTDIYDCVHGGCESDRRPAHAAASFGRVSTRLPGHITQDVYVFERTWQIRQRFAYYRDVTFRAKSAPAVGLQAHPLVTFRSTYADEQAVGCGKNVVAYCRALLRYRNILVEVYVDVASPEDEGGLAIEHVDSVLRAVDARVVRCGIEATLPPVAGC